MKKYIPHFTYKYLVENYVERGKSTYQIAEENNTYSNRVNRDLAHYGIPLRSKSECQRNALETKRTKHPTEGTTRPESVKNKIGKTVSDTWNNTSEEEKVERRAMAKENWDKLTPEHKMQMQHRAAQSVYVASKEGSKLEQFILMELRKKGFPVEFHKVVTTTGMQVDLLLPESLIAIEIDGPSHFDPQWGEDKLREIQEKDNKKNQLLIRAGFTVIRVQARSKTNTKVYMETN